MAAKFKTREEWLVAAVEALRPLFAEADAELPPVRVSVGFAGGSGRKNSTIGQCWSASSAEDGVAQVFISPVLGEADRVLDVLIHELVHAVDDCQSGHKGRFAKLAKAVGLEGKMTATAASEGLKAKLAPIVEKLGDYPHAVLLSGAGVETPKKQGTRMLKLECPADGYIVRTTAKWLELGLPSCPCGEEMVQADAPADGE